MAHLARLLVALTAFSSILALSACEPATLPEHLPGPAGAGLRDPRQTSPNMMSMAQKKWFQKYGSPDETQKNAHGGLDWIYQRSHGSQFGEQQEVETLSFDAGGVLNDQRKETLRRVGK